MSTDKFPNEVPSDEHRAQRALARERHRLVREVSKSLDKPLLWLSIVWLVLLICEMAVGLSWPLRDLTTVIWILFIIDFVLRLFIAPKKVGYLKKNWLFALSLILPVLRVFPFLNGLRAVRVLSATSGWQTVRLFSSINRGLKALRETMSRRRVGYVFALTLVVVITGAAGMYAFEREVPAPQGIHSYWEGLWWTMMLVTTIGSAYWPVTPAGQALCLAISVYALGVLGYLTAALATFFIGRDAENPDAEIVGERSIRELRKELEALRNELKQQRAH